MMQTLGKAHQVRSTLARRQCFPEYRLRPHINCKASEAAPVSAHNRTGGSTVRFCIKRAVNWGEAVGIVGSSEHLGNWSRSPENVLKLTWSQGDVWRAEVWLPSGQVEYKYLIVSESGEFKEWQPASKNNKITASPEVMILEVEDDWNKEGHLQVTATAAPPPPPSTTVADAAQALSNACGEIGWAANQGADGRDGSKTSRGNSSSRGRKRTSNMGPLGPLEHQAGMNGVPPADWASAPQQQHTQHTQQQQQQQHQHQYQHEGRSHQDNGQKHFWSDGGVFLGPDLGNEESRRSTGFKQLSTDGDKPSSTYDSGGHGRRGGIQANGVSHPQDASSSHEQDPWKTEAGTKYKTLAVDPQTGTVTSKFQHMTTSELQRELKRRYLPIYGNREALLQRLNSTVGLESVRP